MDYLGTPADFTILVVVVVIGVVIWFIWDRTAQLQRDMEVLKKKLGVYDPPPGDRP